MPEEFTHDVFLSHSSKDKVVVRGVAERLQKDGLRVWFDEWVLKAGDSIPAKIEAGLEHSRVLVLCMSANAFGSDWAQLESHTFRFKDPLNKERRFIPLRLDDAPIKGSLVQFRYISWLPVHRERAYAELLETCRMPGSVFAELSVPEQQTARNLPVAKKAPSSNDGKSEDCLIIWDKFEALRHRFYEREELAKAVAGLQTHGRGVIAGVQTIGQAIDVRVRMGGERRICVNLLCPVEWKTKLFALHRGDTIYFEGVLTGINGMGIVLDANSLDLEVAPVNTAKPPVNASKSKQKRRLNWLLGWRNS